MAIRVVEFSSGGIRFERFLPKNQHFQMKFLNFKNWISGEPFLYPPFENSTTHIAIVHRERVVYLPWKMYVEVYWMTIPKQLSNEELVRSNVNKISFA